MAPALQATRNACRYAVRCAFAAVSFAFAAAAHASPAPAQAASTTLPFKLPPPGDSSTWTIVIVLTLLTVLPALLLSMTPFVRIIIVFHFLRQGLRAADLPVHTTL